MKRTYRLGLIPCMCVAACTMTPKVAPGADAHAEHTASTTVTAADTSSALPPSAPANLRPVARIALRLPPPEGGTYRWVGLSGV